MADASIHVTDAELAVLRVLWQRGMVTVRDGDSSGYRGSALSELLRI